MLIRVVVENLFSFDDQKEFTTIPNKRLKTLENHKYRFNNFEILKLSSIYGANGAGKSNLIKCLSLFKNLIINEEIPFNLKGTQFKFKEKFNKDQIFAIEFIQDSKAYYYGIKLKNNLISTEELYLSGLGNSPDEMIYERYTNESGSTSIKFLPRFEEDEKSQVLKSVLLEEFVKPYEPILKLLSNRDNKFLMDVKSAFKWFDDTLQIIIPQSKPSALAHRIDTDTKLKAYAEELMCSFNIGVSGLKADKKSLEDFFGEDNLEETEKWRKRVEDSPKKMIGIRIGRGAELVIVKENNKIWVKNLQVEHVGVNQNTVFFDLDEESDGTIRLLDFVPAFQDIVVSNRVYIIDEIERSIHPLLIKQLIKKFSLDKKSKGQLIFSTHESNLLDQEIFRQDEIWFAEKDKTGATDIYSLSDFKEHKTIDIRKGYLNGRYGSIPFLGNLKDLNWHKYDIN